MDIKAAHKFCMKSLRHVIQCRPDQTERLINIWHSSMCARFQKMKNAVFWGVTQLVVVFPYRRFGTTYRSRLHGLKSALNVGPIGCPETSIRNYHYTLLVTTKRAVLKVNVVWIYTVVLKRLEDLHVNWSDSIILKLILKNVSIRYLKYTFFKGP